MFFLGLNACFCDSSSEVFSKILLRRTPLELSTSIIIPCHHSHFKFLTELLENFADQTVLPDEVVISLSEANLVDRESLHRLIDKEWPFLLQIICTNEKKKSGENRNIACEHARGVLLLLMDADDVPHPKRIEITKYIFENYKIDLMLHKFVSDEKTFFLEDFGTEDFDFSSSTYTNLKQYSSLRRVFHSGHPSLLKKVFEKVKWTDKQRAQDVTFILEAFQHFSYVFLAPFTLTLYRSEHSTWQDLSNRMNNFPDYKIKDPKGKKTSKPILKIYDDLKSQLLNSRSKEIFFNENCISEPAVLPI